MNAVDKICNLLLTLPLADYAQGRKWITCRCRYCSDSMNPNHKHFGIHIPQNNEDVFYYNCFKCHTCNRLTTDDLLAWGIYDLEGIEILSKWQKRVLSLPQNKMFNSQVFKVKTNHITMNKLTDAKLKYINNRLGLSLSYNDIIEKKIILNIKDFLQQNKIEKNTRDSFIINQLNTSFLGFLSQDNAFLNMRRLVNEDKVCKSLKKRYVMYNIFDKYDNTQRYYTLPNNIDMYNPKRVKLILAEGPFDLLSIFYNMRNQENDHCIYSSILGSGYIQILEFFIVKMKLINLEVHIYKDNDISEYTMIEIKQLLRVFNIPLVVHANNYPGEKDFGVKKEKIRETILNI